MGLSVVQLRILIVGLILVLAGCMPTTEPESSPTATEPGSPPQPSSTHNTETTSSALVQTAPVMTAPALEEKSAMEVCYLYIVESGEQLGGIPTDLEVLYIAADGLVQASHESTGDVVLALGAEELDTSDLFATLAQTSFHRSPFAAIQQLLEPRVESERAAPALNMEVGHCDGLPSHWRGDPGEIPENLAPLVAQARALGKQVEVEPVIGPKSYLRAQLMEPRKVKELKRADLVIDVTAEQVDANPPLASALLHVRRLVEMPGGAYDEAGFQAVLDQGRSLHVAVGEDVYQVRHLRALESAKP